MRTTILLILSAVIVACFCSILESLDVSAAMALLLGFPLGAVLAHVIYHDVTCPPVPAYDHRQHIQDALAGRVVGHRIAQAQNMADRKIAAGWPPRDAANCEISDALHPLSRQIAQLQPARVPPRAAAACT